MEWTADLDEQVKAMKNYLPTLTPRELETLKMIGRGIGNKDIATAMNVKVSTVRTWTKNIHGKLYVEGRPRLAVLSHHVFCPGTPKGRTT